MSLKDDSLKRRKVALIGGGADAEGLLLLSPTHYLRQALEPVADLIDGSLMDVLLANPDVIVLADVPATPIEHIRQAMRDGVEPLYEGLRGDERNVLLTLARMWRTGVHGDFVTKEQAAEWAIPSLPAELAKTLEYARLAYIGEVFDRLDTRGEEAECLAQALLGNIKQVL